MIVLDTGVLVYAVGADHELVDPCRELVRRVGAGELHATTTTEVLQEFAHVRARRRGRADAVDVAGRYATLLGPLLVTQPGDLGEGLELFRRQERLGAFEAVLAATATRAGASALVSADRAFATVRGLPHLDPAAGTFLDDLDAFAG